MGGGGGGKRRQGTFTTPLTSRTSTKNSSRIHLKFERGVY